MDKPFFTIGIPIFNSEKYILRCLDSVLKQNFTDFEVICVNDGSTDNSENLVASRAEKDGRIKLINKENGGPSSSRNVVIENAGGEYIYFLDSDDEILEDTLGKAYNEIISNNKPDVLQAGILKAYENKQEEVYNNYNHAEHLPEIKSKDEVAISVWLYGNMIAHTGSRFVKNDFVRTAGIRFPTRLFAGEDRYFAFELYRHAESIVYTNFCANRHYMNVKNSIVTNPSFRTKHNIFISWMDFYDDLEFWNISEKLYSEAMKKKNEYLRTIRKDLIYTCLNIQGPEKDKIVNMYDETAGEDIRKLSVLCDGIFYMPLNVLIKILGVKKASGIICRLKKTIGRKA